MINHVMGALGAGARLLSPLRLLRHGRRALFWAAAVALQVAVQTIWDEVSSGKLRAAAQLVAPARVICLQLRTRTPPPPLHPTPSAPPRSQARAAA